jgi:hypothetical protein
VSDIDVGAASGIAITGITGAGGGGTWQYTLNNGASWIAIVASPMSALLLSDAGNVQVRYRPQTGETGTATIAFRAWDRTSGTEGQAANVSVHGGTTAFSSVVASSSVAVSTTFNHAPVLVDADVQMPGVQGNPLSLVQAGSANPGTSVASLLYNLVTDQDDDPQGMAVTGVSSSGAGIWKYTVNNGTTWMDMPAVSENQALLLTDAGTVLVRFIPTGAWDGNATISYRAWDRSCGVNGDIADASLNGGVTAFSAVTATSTVVVDGIVPPMVTLTVGSLTWTENEPAVTLDSGATVTDADSANFAGGSLIIAMNPGRSGDRLEVPDGVIIPGTVSGGDDGASLVVTLTGAATPSTVQTLLRSITYRNNGDNPGSDPESPENRTVTVMVNDGGATSAPAACTLIVDPIDDAPTLQPVTLALVPGLTVTGQLSASDAEGQAMTYAVVGGQTKGEPTVDAITGVLTYRNTFLDGQDDAFIVSVTAGGKTTTATVTVHITPASVAADAPAFTSLPPMCWRAGNIFSYTPTVGGLGSGMVFSLLPKPQVAATRAELNSTTYSFDGTTGTLTITSPTVPTGGYLRCGILAVDADGRSTYQPVLIKVCAGGNG